MASGGMAEIYRARRWTLSGEEDVAIKRLLPTYNADEEFIVMLTDEARTVQSHIDKDSRAWTFGAGVFTPLFLRLGQIDQMD